MEDLLINDHTSSSYRMRILITTPSLIFLTTNIAEIQQILWKLLFLQSVQIEPRGPADPINVTQTLSGRT